MRSRNRRTILKGLALLPITAWMEWPGAIAMAEPGPLTERLIPGTNEKLPIVGLGTYQAFEGLSSKSDRTRLTEVLRLFAHHGGRLIDTSPMYSDAETALGQLLPRVEVPPKGGWFMATKVWVDGKAAGARQMAASAQKTGFPVLDLIQIHNLRDWKRHLETLKEMKTEGKVRYIGATTWGGLRHTELERVMKTGDLDFIQVSYNVVRRDVEQRILPLARDLQLGVIVNRPFAQGDLFGRVRGRALPNWVTTEGHCDSWAQVFLKFVLSDPRVTIAIPATSKPKHLIDNMGAGRGPLPNPEVRERLVKLLSS